MPELQLFRRRWHLSTGAWTIESTGIEFACSVGTQLRVAVYSLVGLFGLCCLVEISFTSIGLKGGPLEEEKRSPVRLLLYAEVALWFALVGFTGYGTYILSSPTVPTSCWDNNPCAYSDQLPGVCTGAVDSLGHATLSGPCQDVADNQDVFQSCFGDWFDSGVSWAVSAWPDPDPWNCSISAAATNLSTGDFVLWTLENVYDGNGTAFRAAFGNFAAQLDQCSISGGSKQDVINYNKQLASCEHATQQMEIAYLELLGISYNASMPSSSTPWIGCMSETCQNVLFSADNCESWDVLLKLGNPSSRKGFVIGLVFGSWGILAVTALAVFIAFNSFPDYEDVAGWEGTLRGFARLCCCTGLMQEAALPSSENTAQRDIAQSLKMLFGGIDLDPTDRFVAAFLVAEEQHRRRRRHATAMLEASGAVPALRARRRLRNWVGGGAAARQQQWGACLLGPEAVAGGVSAHQAAQGGGNEEEAADGQSAQQPTSNTPPPSTTLAPLPMYRHTVLQLASAADAPDSDEDVEKGPRDWDRASSESRSAADRELLTDAAAAPLRGGPRRLTLRVTDRYHPMLTPIGLPRALSRHIAPREAAAVYTGPQVAIERRVLLRAEEMSRFAIGSYGLQNIIWGRGRRPAACAGNLNMLVRCLRSPLRLTPRLRQRNYRAIMEVTGAEPEDFVYASHANRQGGILPYIIMAHRPSKTLVLSLRGTVSMEDLITDLLSHPLDVSEWLPEWVHTANRAKAPLYAHAGIVASATAVLMDLEEKGLLRDLLAARMDRLASAGAGGLARASAAGADAAAARAPALERMRRLSVPASPVSARRAGSADGASASEEGETALPSRSAKPGGAVRLPLSRARAIIRGRSDWSLAVTGHSLGAAVACMLCFQLREQFPELQCWAFNPPGGLLSWELSRIARQFCTSVVVGKDVISRLSFNNLKRTVDEMVVTLARCRRPKLKILGDILVHRRGGRARAPPEAFCELHELSDEVLLRVQKYHETSNLHADSQPEMYPPGRILFLRPFKGHRATQTWDAVWIDAAALMGEGILLAPSMMAHHRTFTLSEAFAEVLKLDEGARPHADLDGGV